jgi:hypothetical protein
LWPIHPLEMLADDVQAGFGHQMVDVGDAAGQRILDRDHRQPGIAGADRGEGILEARARQRLQLRKRRPAGEVGIGAGQALEGDGLVGFALRGFGGQGAGLCLK